MAPRSNLSKIIDIIAFVLPTAVIGAGTFSYDDSHVDGPHNWPALSMDGNQCDGVENSPVAITSANKGCIDNTDSYTFAVGDCTLDNLKFSINDHGLKVDFEDCNAGTVQLPGKPGRTFQALQFHVHESSEHTIDGLHFPGELHIVHKEVPEDPSNSRMYTVVGTTIHFKSPTPNPIFEDLLAGWQEVADSTEAACCEKTRSLGKEEEKSGGLRRAQTSFNVYDLIPDAGFYVYDGGLTTPPCSEVVHWNLSDKQMPISISQYSVLSTLILDYKDPNTCEKATVASRSGSTSRPPQPLNGRTVSRICST